MGERRGMGTEGKGREERERKRNGGMERERMEGIIVVVPSTQSCCRLCSLVFCLFVACHIDLASASLSREVYM